MYYIYNSQNLPLSSKKIIKKTIARTIRWAWIFIPLLIGLFASLVMQGSLYSIQRFTNGQVTNQLEIMPGLKIILIGIILVILSVIAVFIYEYFYYKLYYYEFTGDGAKIRKGVISQATGFVRYDRLQNIYVDQDILDRIFGLYDVHYETAGEISGFYSHVDGLNKENADKLVAFLEGKIKQPASSSQESQKRSEVITQPDTVTEKNKVEGISSLEYPLSKSVIITKTIGLTLVFSILFFGSFGFIFLFKARALLLIGFLIIFLLSWIYSKVWYKNFYFNFDQEKGEIRSKVIGSSISYLYYDRIQNVNLSQPPIPRLFGIYTITIETAGKQAWQKLVLDGLSKESAEKIKDFLLAKSKYYRGGL